MSLTPYTTAEAIQEFFRDITFSVDSVPTLSAVNGWILEGSAYIDGGLNNRYQLPVTNSDDLKQLKTLANMFVLCFVREVAGKTPVRQLSDGSLIPVETDLKQFFNRIQMYRKGDIELLNTSANISRVVTFSFNSENGVSPVSRKCEALW